MENRRDYLVAKLTRYEKEYLRKVAVSTRNKYIRNNYDYLNIKTVELSDKIPSGDIPVFEMVANKCDAEIKIAERFEDIISDEMLYKKVKALSLKEKMVLFSLYCKRKNINQIAKEMNLARETIWRVKNRAINKLIKSDFGVKENV